MRVNKTYTVAYGKICMSGIYHYSRKFLNGPNFRIIPMLYRFEIKIRILNHTLIKHAHIVRSIVIH